MTADLRDRLAKWPAAVAAALGPALDEAAETVAAEARQRLVAVAARDDEPIDPETAIVAGRNENGAAVVTVTLPAAALEYGSSRSAARPFLRPAVAVMADALRHWLGAIVHGALPQRRSR